MGSIRWCKSELPYDGIKIYHLVSVLPLEAS
jgi:hypothetical protein